jgi:uncharacterized membrane protein YqjE
MEYTLSLALFDLLPVLFAAIGFMYIIRLVSFVLPQQGRIAFIGSSLVVAGGFSRAIWKIGMASSGGVTDLEWLENALFVFMAPGYILLAWSVWQTARYVQMKKTFSAWLPPFLVVVLMFLLSLYLFGTSPDSPAWERVLLTMMVIATLLTGILLIAFALHLKLIVAGGLFVVNLLIVLVMNGMARLPEQPMTMQWIEETINTVSWLAFALGARILYQYVRENFNGNASRDSDLLSIAE